MVEIFGVVVLMVSWCAWAYPFIFRAPHHQKRHSITVIGRTRVGLLLECSGIFLAFFFRVPPDSHAGMLRLPIAAILGAAAVILSWTAVAHLGKQFRVHAGLYDDHELVQSGPYAVVRHPIYTSLLAMLLCTILVLTQWLWAALAVMIFVVGTEIRVHTEDNLLASRFGEEFQKYRRRVPAYVPYLR